MLTQLQHRHFCSVLNDFVNRLHDLTGETAVLLFIILVGSYGIIFRDNLGKSFSWHGKALLNAYRLLQYTFSIEFGRYGLSK